MALKPVRPPASPGFDPGGLGAIRRATGTPTMSPPGVGESPTPITQNAPNGVGPASPMDMSSMGTEAPQMVPGVSGVTPGSIERRLGLTPPTMQASGPQMPPSVMAGPMASGNVDQGSLQDPLQMIQALVRRRMAQ